MRRTRFASGAFAGVSAWRWGCSRPGNAPGFRLLGRTCLLLRSAHQAWCARACRLVSFRCQVSASAEVVASSEVPSGLHCLSVLVRLLPLGSGMNASAVSGHRRRLRLPQSATRRSTARQASPSGRPAWNLGTPGNASNERRVRGVRSSARAPLGRSCQSPAVGPTVRW